MTRRIGIILYTCFTISVFSQEKIDIRFSNTQLLKVLEQTELNFKVKFSFDSNIITEDTFSFNKKQCSLGELIDEIENETSLKFNKINDRYYFITAQKINNNFNNLLKEVFITNYVTSGIHKNKNGSVSVLPQELGVLPGLTEPDVLESLKIIPGVQTPNETASDIYVRGGTPDQNLIFWDGIKMYYSGHFFGVLSAFNPYITKKITLSKSGTQARYGNKVSGVIDIVTSENIPKKTTGGFGFNMTHADAFVSVPFSKKVAFTSSLRRSFTDLINSFTFNELSDRVFQTFNANQERNIVTDNVSFVRDNDFYFTDYSAKLLYKTSKNETLSFNFLHNRNRLCNKFSIPVYKDFYEDNLDIKNKGLSFLWKKKLTQKLSHRFKIYYSNFELNYSGNYDYIDGFLIKKLIKKNSVSDLGFSYNLNYSRNNGTNFLFGYELLSNETKYLIKNTTDINDVNQLNTTQEDKGFNTTHSLFSEYIYDTNNWAINGGIRLNYFNRIDKFVIEPRLYLEKKLNRYVSLKASLEKKHQALSQIIEFQTSNLGFDLENKIWAQVNNNTTPLQSSFQVSSGLLFNKKNWKIDIESYFKEVNGMTSNTNGYNDQTEDFSNGKGKIFGIDLLINKKLGNYRTWINYSYTKNRFKFIDLENKFFPANHDITNYFSWSHAYKLNNYEFSLGWSRRTGNPYTAIHEFKINPENGAPIIVIDTDNINAQRLPSYHRLDGSVTYSFNFFNDWKGKIGFSVLNIYNKKNLLNRTYISDPILGSDNIVTYKMKKIDRISLGVTPNLVFRLNF